MPSQSKPHIQEEYSIFIAFSQEEEAWILHDYKETTENAYIRILETNEITFLTKLATGSLSPFRLIYPDDYDEKFHYSVEILDLNKGKLPILLSAVKNKEAEATIFNKLYESYFSKNKIPSYFYFTENIDTMNNNGNHYFLTSNKINLYLYRLSTVSEYDKIVIIDEKGTYFDNLEKIGRWCLISEIRNLKSNEFNNSIEINNNDESIFKSDEIYFSTNLTCKKTGNNLEEPKINISIKNTYAMSLWIHVIYMSVDYSIQVKTVQNTLLNIGESFRINNIQLNSSKFPIFDKTKAYQEYIKILVTTDSTFNLDDFYQNGLNEQDKEIYFLKSLANHNWQMFDIQLNVEIEKNNELDDIEKEIQLLKSKIGNSEKTIRVLYKKLESIDTEIIKVNKDLKYFKHRSAAVITKRDVLEKEKNQILKEIEDLRSSLEYDYLELVRKNNYKLTVAKPFSLIISDFWNKTTKNAEPSAILRYRKDREEHLLLAMFAAFPVYITADLLYRLWQHFGKNYDVPRVAVSDLLLSNILEESSTEMFEYEPELRKQLLQSLKEYFTALRKPEILKDLGVFMLDYIAAKYNKNVAYTEPVREMEEWNALAYCDPATANRQLAEALNPSTENNYKIRQLRAAIVTASLDNSLRSLDSNVQSDFSNVLQFSKGIRAFVSNKYEKTYEELQKVKGIQYQEVAESNVIYSIKVPIPKKVVPSEILKQSLVRTTHKLFISSDSYNEKDTNGLILNEAKLLSLLKTNTYQIIRKIEDNLQKEGWLDNLKIQENDTFFIYSTNVELLRDIINRLEKYKIKIVIIADCNKESSALFTFSKVLNMVSIFASLYENRLTIKKNNKEIGLFTQKFIEVLTQSDKALTYAELFNRIYSKVTQQTGKQQPKIEYYGEAKSDDIFLDGFLNTVPPKNQQAAKMSVGFGNDVPKEFIDIAIDIFKKEGESLFFDLVTDNENLDYIIQKIGENEYTLQTSVGEDITFPSFEFQVPSYLVDNSGSKLVDNSNNPLMDSGDSPYKLITVFNNIDRVANWQYTLNLHSSAGSALSDKDVEVTFSITDFDKNISIDEPISLVVGGNRVKVRFNFNTNIEGVIYFGLVYLGKDFEVSNQILEQLQVGENPANLSKGANWDYPKSFLNKRITNVTEYVKVLISRTPFETGSLNRDALREKEEVTRSIGSRSELTDYNFHQKDILVKTIILNLTWFDVMKESRAIFNHKIANPLRSMLDLGAAEWDDMSAEDKYRYIVELEKEHTLLFWIKEYEYYYTKINSEPIRVQRIKQSLESLTQDCPYEDIAIILQNVRAKYFEISIEEIRKKDSDFLNFMGNLKMKMPNYQQQARAILGKLCKESTLRFLLDFNSAEFDLSKKGELLSLGVDDSNMLSKKYETIEKLNEYRPLLFWINDYRFYYLYQTNMKHVVDGVLFTLGVLGKNCKDEKIKQILIETKKQYILNHNIKGIKNNIDSNSYSTKEYFENWIG